MDDTPKTADTPSLQKERAMDDNGTRVQQWAERRLKNGLVAEEVIAVCNVCALLEGAVAAAVDAMERPSEAVVLEVFRQICYRVDSPMDVPIRTVH